MMNAKKIIGLVLSLAIVVGVAVLAIKLLSGALALAHGVLNTILGVLVILALAAIVLWMFSYAKKMRK